MSSNTNENDGCITGLALIVLGVVAMPLVGLYLWFFGKTEHDKSLGAGIAFVGFIILAVCTIISKL